MPCFFPMQATFSLRDDGKKSLVFSNTNARLFKEGVKPSGDNNLTLPCGKCMGCRIERSRQWAIRCMHEAKCHEQNCFVTLTYAPEFLPEGGNLVRKHLQDFIKRLRNTFVGKSIRYYYCGEYGDKLDRPHYHLCLFGHDFSDKKQLSKRNGNWIYTSEILSKLWPFGHASVGAFTYETAAYVARYVTKKICGDQSKEHYGNKTPEFGGMSLKPGIGAKWFEKYGETDVMPHDNIIVKAKEAKVPRYYDILMERKDPERFVKIKEARKEFGKLVEFDNTADRLAVKYKIFKSKIRLLPRKLESSVG